MVTSKAAYHGLSVQVAVTLFPSRTLWQSFCLWDPAITRAKCLGPVAVGTTSWYAPEQVGEEAGTYHVTLWLESLGGSFGKNSPVPLQVEGA